MLVPNCNAEPFLSLSFGTTLEPGLGCREEILWPRSKLSCLGRETHTTGKFDSAGRANATGAQGELGLLLQGVLANCTEDPVPGLRPEAGWLVGEPREHTACISFTLWLQAPL